MHEKSISRISPLELWDYIKTFNLFWRKRQYVVVESLFSCRFLNPN